MRITHNLRFLRKSIKLRKKTNSIPRTEKSVWKNHIERKSEQKGCMIARMITR